MVCIHFKNGKTKILFSFNRNTGFLIFRSVYSWPNNKNIPINLWIHSTKPNIPSCGPICFIYSKDSSNKSTRPVVIYRTKTKEIPHRKLFRPFRSICFQVWGSKSALSCSGQWFNYVTGISKIRGKQRRSLGSLYYSITFIQHAPSNYSITLEMGSILFIFQTAIVSRDRDVCAYIRIVTVKWGESWLIFQPSGK